MLWLALPALMLLFSIGKPFRAFRFRLADGAALALFVWHSAAALAAVSNGMPRTALNALWLWLGLGSCYLCVRQVTQCSRDARLLAAVLCGLAAAQSVLGGYQSLWAIPSARAEFVAAERSVAMAGLNVPDDSPVRLLFESRLGGNEPLGTFTLTNSLAGWLAPWIVLLVWILGDHVGWLWNRPVAKAGGKRRRKTSPDRSDPPSPRLDLRSTVRIVGLAAILLVALFTLVRTGSRTGLAATCVGVGLLALPWANRQWKSPSVSRRLLVGAAALSIAGAFGLALVLGGAAASLKSLQFRFDYWRTTVAIIADRPWLGCGPGQFQQAYTAAKTPPAGEEPSDPHNALLEIWATAGTPAALAWIVFCGLIGLVAFRAARRTNPPSPGGEPPRPISGESARTPNVDSASVPRGFRHSVFDSIQSILPGIAALLLGYLIFTPISWMTRAVVDLWLVWATLPAALLCLGLLGDWVQHGRLPAWVVAVAWASLVINLGAAGGIGFPGVAAAFWMLAALCLNIEQADAPAGSSFEAPFAQTHKSSLGADSFTESPHAGSTAAPSATIATQRRADPPTGIPPAVLWPALVIAFGLVYACHATAYRPVLRCSGEMLAAERLSAAADPLPALAAWRAAADADPWAFEPRAALAAAQFALWRKAPHPDQWLPIRELLDAAIARAGNWSAAWLWKGRLLLDAAQVQMVNGERAAPRAAADAVEAFRFAVKCYPASPANWAYLAVAEDRLGLPEARETARCAIQLDAENPHQDKKLPEPLRQTLQAISLKE